MSFEGVVVPLLSVDRMPAPLSPPGAARLTTLPVFEYDALPPLMPVVDTAITPAQLALAWILRRGEVTSAIVGATRPEQITENAKAADLELPYDVLARLDTLTAPGEKTA